MKNKEFEFTNILLDILIKQNASYSLDRYAFVCGNKWNSGLKEYKGIPIYYFNDELIKDIIQLIPSPMIKDYD